VNPIPPDEELSDIFISINFNARHFQSELYRGANLRKVRSEFKELGIDRIERVRIHNLEIALAFLRAQIQSWMLERVAVR